MAVKVLRVFQEFTSAGYVPMPIAGNIDYGVTVANTFPATTPATFQTDDPDIEVDVTEVTDFYVWIRSHGTAWNYLYTRNVRVYPDSPTINNVVMGIIIARLTDAVPYTGATQDTDLGEFGLKAGWLGLDLTPTNTPTDAGTMSWNDQDGTANLILKGGNVTLQIGQEQVTRVVNKTGSSLLEANYQAVRISGAQGNRLKVALAQANNDANSAETLGIVTETILNNEEGFITTSGLVRNIDTTGTIQGEIWADGDMLYLSGTTAGQLTNVKPQAPTHTVIMGYVVRAHATQGQIYVKVDNGYELDELHNVKITTPTDKDFLIYDGTNQYWKNRDLFGTTGYLPVYDTTSLLKDSIIYTDGTAIGIGTNVLQSGAVATFGDVAHFTENISLADSKGIVSGGVNMLSRNNLNNQIIIGADGGINDNVAFYAGDLERMRLLANGRLAVNKTTASYQVDVQGDVNVSGAFRVNGTIIPNGTVTSVAMSVPTGLVISGSPITSSGTLAVTYAVNYGIPTLTKQSDWDDAYTWVTNFPDQLGNAGKFLTTNGSALSWASLVTGVSSVFGRTGAVVAQSGDYTTAQVTESGNLYYTDARARLALSGGTGITYNNTTGVIAYSGTVYTDSSIRALFSAGAGISYNNTTGVITSTITQYTDAMARASLSFVAGSGAYNSTTGVITIPTNTNQLTNGASFITLASLSASAPLSYNNGTGAFSISQASGSTNGFLSSTDWNTFNNKQNALGYTPVPTTRTLTINGTSYDLSADRSWTIASGIGGSGTTNYLPKFTASTTLGNSLIFDNGTSIGINLTNQYANGLTIKGSSDDYSLTLAQSNASNAGWGQWADTGGNYKLSRYGGGAYSSPALTITLAGAATFSSSVTAGVITSSVASGTGTLKINNTSISKAWSFYPSTNGSQTDLNLYEEGTGVTAMTFKTGGNVGIGTTSPKSITNGLSLTIGDGGTQHQPYLALARNSTGGYWAGIRWYDGSTIKSFIEEDGNFDFKFGTNNAERMRITSTGNVGIGTSSPSRPLDVVGSIRTQAGTIDFSNDFNNQIWFGSGVFNFKVNGAERMYLNSSGNLGLGVTPSAWLSGYPVIQMPQLSIFSGAGGGGFIFGNAYLNTSGSFIYQNSGLGASAYNNQGGGHQWSVAPSGTAGTAISFTQAMTLDASGRLGIGTTSPNQKITISDSGYPIIGFNIGSTAQGYIGSLNGGGIALNSQIAQPLMFYTNDTERMRITSGGNVGIGLTNPSQKFEVKFSNSLVNYEGYYSTTDYVVQRISGGASGTGAYTQYSDGVTYNFAIGTTTGGDFTFFNNRYPTNAGSELMRITKTGNVGIGSTSPNQKLEVDGGSSAVALRVSTTNTGAGVASLILANSSKSAFNDGVKISHGAGYTNITDLNNTNIMTWDMSNARVGIGTTSPNQKLTIDSGTSTASYLQFTAGSTTGTASTDGFHIGIDSAGKAIINQRENLSFGISTNNTERVLINNSGIITITGNMRFYYANSPAYVIQLPNDLNDGQAIAYAWVAYSDARVKKNVSELNYGIDSIMKLKPVSYNHHSVRNNQGKIDILEKYKYEIGFIAQEVYNVIPEVVNPGNDLELWGMNYERLTSVIVKGMQEQQEIIEQLKEEIKQLKGVN